MSVSGISGWRVINNTVSDVAKVAAAVVLSPFAVVAGCTEVPEGCGDSSKPVVRAENVKAEPISVSSLTKLEEEGAVSRWNLGQSALTNCDASTDFLKAVCRFKNEKNPALTDEVAVQFDENGYAFVERLIHKPLTDDATCAVTEYYDPVEEKIIKIPWERSAKIGEYKFIKLYPGDIIFAAGEEVCAAPPTLTKLAQIKVEPEKVIEGETTNLFSEAAGSFACNETNGLEVKFYTTVADKNGAHEVSFLAPIEGNYYTAEASGLPPSINPYIISLRVTDKKNGLSSTSGDPNYSWMNIESQLIVNENPAKCTESPILTKESKIIVEPEEVAEGETFKIYSKVAGSYECDATTDNLEVEFYTTVAGKDGAHEISFPAVVEGGFYTAKASGLPPSINPYIISLRVTDTYRNLISTSGDQKYSYLGIEAQAIVKKQAAGVNKCLDNKNLPIIYAGKIEVLPKNQVWMGDEVTLRFPSAQIEACDGAKNNLEVYFLINGIPVKADKIGDYYIYKTKVLPAGTYAISLEVHDTNPKHNTIKKAEAWENHDAALVVNDKCENSPVFYDGYKVIISPGEKIKLGDPAELRYNEEGIAEKDGTKDHLAVSFLINGEPYPADAQTKKIGNSAYYTFTKNDLPVGTHVISLKVEDTNCKTAKKAEDWQKHGATLQVGDIAKSPCWSIPDPKDFFPLVNTPIVKGSNISLAYKAYLGDCHGDPLKQLNKHNVDKYLYDPQKTQPKFANGDLTIDGPPLPTSNGGAMQLIFEDNYGNTDTYKFYLSPIKQLQIATAANTIQQNVTKAEFYLLEEPTGVKSYSIEVKTPNGKEGPFAPDLPNKSNYKYPPSQAGAHTIEYSITTYNDNVLLVSYPFNVTDAPANQVCYNNIPWPGSFTANPFMLQIPRGDATLFAFAVEGLKDGCGGPLNYTYDANKDNVDNLLYNLDNNNKLIPFIAPVYDPKTFALAFSGRIRSTIVPGSSPQFAVTDNYGHTLVFSYPIPTIKEPEIIYNSGVHVSEDLKLDVTNKASGCKWRWNITRPNPINPKIYQSSILVGDPAFTLPKEEKTLPSPPSYGVDLEAICPDTDPAASFHVYGNVIVYKD